MSKDEDKEALDAFLRRIDEYLENQDLAAPKMMEEYREVEALLLSDLRRLNNDDCFNYSFMLANYAEHVSSQRAKQEAIVGFCNHYLNKIIAREYESVRDVFGPYDMKESMICRENAVAQKLLDFRHVAKARVLSLKSKEYNVRRKIDCLVEKGKRI